MDNTSLTTPGVYITELPASPDTMPGVPTAVPAFIGYTEKASADGKSLLLQPTPINSLAEYQTFFGGPAKPSYVFEPVTAPDAADVTVGGGGYKLVDTTPGFNLYRNLQLFFANGGAQCYIVSVGDYSAHAVTEAALEQGLTAVATEGGPTILCIPEAVLLPTASDFGQITQAMLTQCGQNQDRFAVLDVWGQDTLTQSGLDQQLPPIVEAFKQQTGDIGLSYGAAYLPLLRTTVVTTAEVDASWFADRAPLPGRYTLRELLEQAITAEHPRDSERHKALTAAALQTTSDTQAPDAHALLLEAVPLYAKSLHLARQRANLLPPSAAVAGVYTLNDSTNGVWNAPANVSVAMTEGCWADLNDTQQAPLHMPLDGKAINVLRDFVGRGIVVWGARTLEGNSKDWRYIQVRRTVIYIENSIKMALRQFVFAPNDSSTWTAVTAMLNRFLTDLWSQGGLFGDTAAQAFTVSCGLGGSMTEQDILEGRLIVTAMLSIESPNEYISLTFWQQMSTS